MRELIIIRTHFYCEATERLYNYLKSTSDRDVAFICDETNGAVEVGTGKLKISISEKSSKDMKLHVPQKFGWLCGDYSLYAASHLLGAYDRYWLIESDVRIGLDSSAEFFDRFNDESIDFLAFHMFKAKQDWFWHSPMCYFEPDVYACLFPVVGISKRAVRFAYQARKEMSETFEDIVPPDEIRRWPNDESFLMSTLMANGFNCKSLDAGSVKYRTNDSFNVGLPKSEKKISEQAPSGLFYHPVHSKVRFVSKANTWLDTYTHNKATKKRLKDVFHSDFLQDLRVEASDDEFLKFERRLLEAIQNASG
ncbi:hypothetical protein [Paracoccus endophyticus]|uniref:hypothetical protein n=1 Tax=Paracoccus endophyticus TaxID=2233774 RepID=UPI0013A6EE6B|nr:hypothetical protein [Paracoccus endophyticus]